MGLGRVPTPILPEEVDITAVRAQGAGGQNVNKVSSAIHLRYDIRAASLPHEHKLRLLALDDRRITRSGVVVIKAQTQRTQEANRAEALARLQALLDSVAVAPLLRRPTRPPRRAARERLADKRHRAVTKLGRSRGSGLD